MGAIRQWLRRRFLRNGVDEAWEAEFEKHGGHTYRFQCFDQELGKRGRKRTDERHHAMRKAASRDVIFAKVLQLRQVK